MATLDRVLLDADSNDAFIRQMMSSLVLATKASNEIPKGDDFGYYATFPQFASLADETGMGVAKLIKDLCEFVEPGRPVDLPDDLLDPSLYEHVVDVIDKLLENADAKMEEASGKSKALQLNKSVNLSLEVDKERIMKANVVEVEKPQNTFLNEIDNSRERPFRPRLRHKYHALAPLDLTEHHDAVSDPDVVSPASYFAHPYEKELRKLKYGDWQLSDPSSYQPIRPSPGQPVEFIDNEDDLRKAIDELSGQREIAVDLEHHSYRSFQGFTCLMQISSRFKDYLIDTLAVRSHLHEMGAVFADPSILKVMHGCENDIMWLQKDFGLYVVNCFDTYHAAKALKYPALSLAHLLKYYANIKANKKYQLSDWRQRPLPQEMLDYARSDTHHLLFIYDCIRRDLWKVHGLEGVESVLNASRKLCLKRYEKEPFWPLGYRKLLSSDGVPPGDLPGGKSPLTEEQDLVMAALWGWRDRKAREQDESVLYVMSNAEVLRLGTSMPRNVQQLEGCGPLSELVRQHAAEVLGVISSQLQIGPSASGATTVEAAAAAREAAQLAAVGAKPPSKSRQQGTSIAFDASASSASEGGSGDRLYGRALQTPSKEVLQKGGAAGEEEGDRFSSNTIFTFTPAVVPVQQGQQHQRAAQGDFSSVAGGGVQTGAGGRLNAMSPPLGRDGKPSPVMNADDIFRLAGWSTPMIPLNLGLTGIAAAGGAGGVIDSPTPFMRKDESSGSKDKDKSPAVRVVGGAGISEENRRRLEQAKAHIAKVASANEAIAKGGGGKDAAAAASAETSLADRFEEANRSPIAGSGSSAGTALLTTTSASSQAGAEDADGDGDSKLSAVPGSFEEIYYISNQNRRRNKELKRTRDDDGTGPLGGNVSTSVNASIDGGGGGGGGRASGKSTQTSAGKLSTGAGIAAVDEWSLDRDVPAKKMSDRVFDENVYFACGAQATENPGTVDIESTLDFAESIGWVASADRNDIRESHLAEQQAHADAHPGDGDGSSTITGGGHNMRGIETSSTGSGETANSRMGSQQGYPPKIKGAGTTPPRRSQQHHTQQRGGGGSGGGLGPNHRSTDTKPFDYGNAPQSLGALGGAVIGAVGGGSLSGSIDSTGSSGGRTGGANNRGPRQQQHGSGRGQSGGFNPYLQGRGAGAAGGGAGGGAAGRGGGGGTGHFNPEVERRDPQERTFIYSGGRSGGGGGNSNNR